MQDQACSIRVLPEMIFFFIQLSYPGIKFIFCKKESSLENVSLATYMFKKNDTA